MLLVAFATKFVPFDVSLALSLAKNNQMMLKVKELEGSAKNCVLCQQ
jgi:hypothetical protein